MQSSGGCVLVHFIGVLKRKEIFDFYFRTIIFRHLYQLFSTMTRPGQEIYLFCKTSKQYLGPTHSSIEGASGDLLTGATLLHFSYGSDGPNTVE